MTTIPLQYGVTFGKGDSSDWCDWGYDVDGELEKSYLRAKMLRQDLNCELEYILDLVYPEIEQEEIRNAVEFEDEYALECTGQVEVDADEINDLVAHRDPHALEFFGLTGLSDEELDDWDADIELDELPLRCDFEEGFEPESPFDCGWCLNVQFEETLDMDDLEEKEARETLAALLTEANGDYSVVDDYVVRCEDLYVGDASLAALANEIAAELGLPDYLETHKT